MTLIAKDTEKKDQSGRAEIGKYVLLESKGKIWRNELTLHSPIRGLLAYERRRISGRRLSFGGENTRVGKEEQLIKTFERGWKNSKVLE